VQVLANIFYEPSTRTSSSFATAIQRLGGGLIFIGEDVSSIKKGEDLADTIRTAAVYADILVLRHTKEGAAAQAAAVTECPLINAGDGIGEHPTQALLDVYTMAAERSKKALSTSLGSSGDLSNLEGITVTMVGDLKNGRTVHSLSRLLANFKVTINYVAPGASFLCLVLHSHTRTHGPPVQRLCQCPHI
jgi:aspartate carbamoyltransferase catalytic subunit